MHTALLPFAGQSAWPSPPASLAGHSKRVLREGIYRVQGQARFPGSEAGQGKAGAFTGGSFLTPLHPAPPTFSVFLHEIYCFLIVKDNFVHSPQTWKYTQEKVSLSAPSAPCPF